jgi:hypothetical protein
MIVNGAQLAATYMQVFIQWYKADEIMKLAYAPAMNELKRALIDTGTSSDTIKELEDIALSVDGLNNEIEGKS